MNKFGITLTQFTLSFVPFALLLAAALMVPEAGVDLGMDRTVYTIWATTVLVTPALCAFALPGNSPVKHNMWLLYWTFAFFAYIVHLYYGIFVAYQGSFQEFMAGQGVFPAIVNVVFTLWWALDVYLAWFKQDGPSWITKQRLAVHIFIGLTFFGSTVFMKHGFINVIGGLFTASLAICLMIRWDASRRPVATVVQS